MSKDPLQSARRMVARLLGLQVTITLIVAGVFLAASTATAAKSALLGGVLGIVPNIFYAWRVFRRRRLNQPSRIVWSFYSGECLKLVLTGVLFVIIIKLFTISLLPFIIAFAATFMAFWLMPLLLSRHSRR